MINIKNITIRNFMSVGNVTQGVRFDESGLTLVLGNNVDFCLLYTSDAAATPYV